MLESEVEVEFQPSPFFNEQLTAFELWLEHGSDEKKPPEQLPIVLQVSLTHSPPRALQPQACSAQQLLCLHQLNSNYIERCLQLYSSCC
jgi:hypothetical protein